MPRIVIIPYNIASKLNPTFELARRLLNRGHHISIVGEPALQELVETQGIPFFVAGERSSMSKPKKGQLNPFKYLFFPPPHIEASFDTNDMQGFPEMLADLNPDLVLIDVEQHLYIISVVPTGIPVALISTLVSLFKCPGLPPPHLGIIPGIGFKGSKIGIEYLWLRFRLGKWRNRLRERINKKGLDRLSILRHHAKRTGFDFRTEVDLNQWMIPLVYRSLPLLAIMTREFDFPHIPPPHYHHVGALINVSRREVVKTDEDRTGAQLNSLLSEHRNNPTQSKLIYCSFGAFFKGEDTDFWIKLIGALGEHTFWKVIFGLGGRVKASSLGRLPANIYAFKWVPQLHVLKFADCAIIHGGITSINECIASGVPMLVFPFNSTDQHGAAARVAYHRVGIVGDRRHDDSMKIRNKVERILNDSKYLQNVLQMRSYFDRDLYEDKAVKTVESLLYQSKK